MSAGRMTWLSSPTRSLTSSSRSPPATVFQLLSPAAGGGKGSRESNVALLSLPTSCPRARQAPSAPRGALWAGCPLCHPGCAGEVSCAGSRGSPELAQGLGGGGGLAPMPWAPQGGTEWVLPIGGGSVAGDPDAGLGGGVDLGTASTGRGDMAPHGSSAQVRNSSRHAIYHRRRSGKLLYKRISSAGRAGEAGLHGPWAARRG